MCLHCETPPQRAKKPGMRDPPQKKSAEIECHVCHPNPVPTHTPPGKQDLTDFSSLPEVPCAPLNAVMNKAGISRVNWLILDVEGAHLTDATP
jgi:hypothetical protein